MERILYITILPKEYGGEMDGGVATHSVQLILKAKKEYKVSLYSNINEIKNIDGVTLYKEDNKFIKILKSLYGYLLVDKEKLKKIKFLKFKEKLRVLYHFCKLKNLVSMYNVVHIHSLHNDCITALSLIENKPKVVVTDHGFWQGDIEKSIEKVRYNSFNTNRVIYISEYAKVKHVEYKLNTSNLIKIYNPYLEKELKTKNKNEIKKTLNIDEKKKIIFFSGVSEPVKRKGLGILLDSISNDSYLRNNTVIIIVTNEEGLNFIKKYNGLKNIVALKPMSYSKIIDYYSISDVFVLPSNSESFGLVYIESLSYGTPVIGFDKVIKEFQSIYRPLYIGEPFNPREENNLELALKIKSVLLEEIDETKLIDKTLDLFSWDNLFAEFKKIYSDSAKNKCSNE
ncbi:glycosyltransferase family 4 protein [Peribacillus sp. NPDC101481]|uniref:glycosyltransferase family 4 protein n=1 Tax=Peribacillus sp. NPDC101481 TaxID=3364403 RepID=UPI0038209D0A